MDSLDYLYSKRYASYTIVVLISDILGHSERPGQGLLNALTRFQDLLRQLDFEEFRGVLEAMIKTLQDDTAIARLAQKLKDSQTLFIAAAMLGWYGSRAKGVLPKLVGIASTYNEATEVAKQSVLLIGDAEKEILAALRMSVSEPDDEAFTELASLAKRAGCEIMPEFQELLEEAARSSSADIRELVADTIEFLPSPIKKRFAAILEQLSQDPVERVRAQAIEASKGLAE